MEGADEDMDLETAQAQLDIAMAFTDSLVTGWMKASKAKLPSAASRGNNDFDLDEYMRRPPRLGLGASIPPSSSVHSHEASKLRSKLVGNGKKRAREDDDATPGPSAIVISDDDEESRARMTTKKTRLDPFAPKPKKKAKVDPPTSQPTSSPAKATASSSKPKPTSKVSDVEEIPRPDGLAPSNEPAEVVSADSSMATPATASAQVSPARPQPPKPVPQLSPQRLDPFGNPLLNLDGPPPDAGDEAAESAKKKRKRKKKKKKHTMADPAADMEVIDVDADDDGDEGED
ncbi:hypothetical protein LXA43DRAFT_975636 [Ganoderma leucocontextum]|nr:hypothetical protein LXA43DRAFT_975636 [Ganoderma leucocontextum]